MKLRVEQSSGGTDVFVDNLENGVCVHSWYCDKRGKDVLDVYATNGDTESAERKLLVSMVDEKVVYPSPMGLPDGYNFSFKGTDRVVKSIKEKLTRFSSENSEDVLYQYDCLNCQYYTKALSGDVCSLYHRPIKLLNGVPR
ncbi:MAG: hypothetical protein U9N61_02925, partial [Euryarchaeota archaeon]|nr:hypothetical protein [Euryarchaeota archaeon]